MGDSLTIEAAWRKYDDIESRLTGSVSERMLDLAELRPGMRVLDLASGRGEPSLRAAQRVGSRGMVVGVDVSEPMLAIAREQARQMGIANIHLRVGDVESVDGIPEAPFDVATVRWGFMSLRTLVNTRCALKPGGVLVAAFWAERQRCPWGLLWRQTLERYRPVPSIDPEVPGAFRYGDPTRIARDFGEAGFAIEHVEEMDIPVIEVETGAGIVEWVRDLGLASSLANDLSDDERAAWEADLAREAERFRVGATIRLGGVTRLVVARSTR